MKKNKDNFISSSVAKYKKNYYCLFLPFIFIVFLYRPSLAYDAIKGKVSASTGPILFTSDTFKGIHNFYKEPEIGWSLIAEAVIGETSGLEIGLFYFTKSYLRTLGNDYLIQKGKRVYITTGYRYWWGQYFSTALNLYSSYTIGNTKDVYRSNNLPPGFKTSAEKITNYGLDSSFRFEYAINKIDGIALDLRYSYSVTAKDNEDSNHISVGLSYIREIPVK